MLLSSTGLPDSFVDPIPFVANPVGHVSGMGPKLVGDRLSVLVEQVDRVQQLAVYVEPELIVCAVADADRLRAAIVVEMVQRDLSEFVPAVEPVHDLQRSLRTGFASASLHPRHKPFGRFREADSKQPVQRECSVSNPRVAVVPVSEAAQMLWQAGGGSRDNRAGRLERQKFEHQRGALHHLTPPPHVSAL